MSTFTPQARNTSTPQLERSILLVGVDPALIDARIMSQLDVGGPTSSRAEIDAALAELGFAVQVCVLDLGETAEAVLERALTTEVFDCVMIGAGLRGVLEHTVLFERVMNIVRRFAPSAVLCFNSRPGDTVDAARRAIADSNAAASARTDEIARRP